MFNTILKFQDLEKQFGILTDPPAGEGPSVAADDLVGGTHRALLAELSTLVMHQWNSPRLGAVRGFLLSGPPGVGKTSLVRRVAYELGHRFRRDGASDVGLVLIDGSDIARARYGESEERIREVFRLAASGLPNGPRQMVILFDDVESILMARGSSNAKEWHFSQDSVFFHGVDDIDTRRSTLFLTTNRPDLVDEAIIDRFLCYAIPHPGKDLLVEVALQRARQQGLLDGHLVELRGKVIEAADADGAMSIRAAERMVVRYYVERVLAQPSAALMGPREILDDMSRRGSS